MSLVMCRIAAVAIPAFFLMGPSGSADVTLGQVEGLFASLLSSAREDQLSPAAMEKIVLGRALYFDPRLSASGTHSCNSCHNLALGGDDNLSNSVGHEWQSAPRNTPSILNSTLNKARFWDGQVARLEQQAMGPVRTGVEFSNSAEQVVKTITSMPQYVEWFEAAFPSEPDPVTFDNTVRAIDAFKATLITPSRFDHYLNGDDAALSAYEKEGLALFISKGCASCHNGINVGGHDYYPFRVVVGSGLDAEPIGYRDEFAAIQEVEGDDVFRAPSLRNVARTAPYFHSGSVWELEAAVGIMADAQLGEEMIGAEIDKVTAFLRSLSGTIAPFEYPLLPVETVSTPRPNGGALPY